MNKKFFRAIIKASTQRFKDEKRPHFPKLGDGVFNFT